MSRTTDRKNGYAHGPGTLIGLDMVLLKPAGVRHHRDCPDSWIALPTLLAGGFVTIFDMFVVNLASASIQHNLNASFAEIGLVIVCYQLTFGLFLVTGGRLGDIHGRSRIYAKGMLCFAADS